jgi:cobalt-zinc-cadmium efflux system membrane fusion protein
LFVTATFHGEQKEVHATVPATAVVHLHDSRLGVRAAGRRPFLPPRSDGGRDAAGDLQELLTGIKPGDPVVRNGLVLQSTAEQ